MRHLRHDVAKAQAVGYLDADLRSRQLFIARVILTIEHAWYAPDTGFVWRRAPVA